ncbi:MAG: hypothetical protein HOD43_08305 [Candidatus Marinimicrobia bacterium]|jgi:sulfite exporter TauE/SafE|nr:hypothetical protein [Candidatus Neomarinimicrobiota bacterium]MBT3630493.1 hypothetical protein [Candidatus Neomarinimicrobiota bacterium]MBT3823967.1 hypothetical protein [Candidatus Neomarinimicrobiota bacterium]MBT4129197.1 hypothetical protein [Candidatus Neomarinimicrobiota bacterium]MBT4295791.1 hypothetical protein [Candidatus Neomarinimicrobiota bacterium]
MENNISTLVTAAATIGFVHTVLGPDHYLPFVAMSKSGRWSMMKTALVTFICGVGHVAGSIVLGFLGISLGLALAKLQAFESFRGDLAAWGLIILGLLYTGWGVLHASKNRPHTHSHIHTDGEHEHFHGHIDEHDHVHKVKGKALFSPWALLIIFVFGPCEALIPLLMYPASEGSTIGLVMVTLVFAIATIGTMLVIVLGASYGIKMIPMKNFERYTHAIAGVTILLCGVSIQFLGL